MQKPWAEDWGTWLEVRGLGDAWSFAVDLGAVEDGPVATHAIALRAEVQLLEPQRDGLPSAGEWETPRPLEDRLAAGLNRLVEAIPVARIYNSGTASFYLLRDHRAG